VTAAGATTRFVAVHAPRADSAVTQSEFDAAVASLRSVISACLPAIASTRPRRNGLVVVPAGNWAVPWWRSHRGVERAPDSARAWIRRSIRRAPSSVAAREAQSAAQESETTSVGHERRNENQAGDLGEFSSHIAAELGASAVRCLSRIACLNDRVLLRAFRAALL